MLGDFLTRLLVLLLGYAYPAFECFKSIEKNNIGIEELRFWCQYWIVVGIFTVCERIGDIFISWLPMYGEVKVAMLIYLWSPKTKGTAHVYDTMFKPFLVNHEKTIDTKLNEAKTRGRDFIFQYGQTFFKIGQEKFFLILQYLASQSGKFTNNANKEGNGNKETEPLTKSDSMRSAVSRSSSINVQVNPEGHSENATRMDDTILQAQASLKQRRSAPIEQE